MSTEAVTVKTRAYVCNECGALMTKRGAGLGKWYCSKNSAHNHRSKTQTKDGSPTSGKLPEISRTIYRRAGRAKVSKSTTTV